MAKEKYFLILILILGFGLRLVNLNQSLWLDEASQAVMSSRSVSEIWSARQGDFHPPLFYILAHYWQQVSHAETWLRLLPVIFGVISIWLIYLLAKNLAGEKFALFSALILAINPYHIYYSQEYRSYSLLAMLGILSIQLFVRKKYILMSIVNTLILYTHYSGIFLIFTQLLLRPITINYLLLTIILFLPWMPRLIEQLRTGVNIDTFLPGWRSVLTLSPIKAIPEIIFKFMAGRINLFPKWIYGIYILFVLGVTGLAVFINKFERKLLWVWLGMPIVASFLLSFWIPQTQPFRLLFCLPALALILAGATVKLPKTFMTLIVYISIVGNFLYFTRPRLQREQWLQAINFFQEQNATVVVKFFDKFAPFYWYAPDLKVVTSDKVTSAMKQFWYMEYLTGITDPEHKFQKELESTCPQTLSASAECRRGKWRVVETKNFEGVGLIYKYESRN